MTPVNVPVYSKDFDPVFFYPLGRLQGWKSGLPTCKEMCKCKYAERGQSD